MMIWYHMGAAMIVDNIYINFDYEHHSERQVSNNYMYNIILYC